MKPDRLLSRIKYGEVNNVRFADLLRLCRSLGFDVLRTSGSHHILGHRLFAEMVNLQEVRGEAKPYQIRQLVRLVERYNLQIEDSP